VWHVAAGGTIWGDDVVSRLEKLKRMLEVDSDDAFLNFGLGMEYVKEGRHAEALAQFKRVQEIDPDYVSAYFQQGNACVAMEDIEGAIEVLGQGVAVAKRVGDKHAATQMSELLAVLKK